MTAPRVWDLIMLGTETDMLECRLREFEDTDCLHVVAEAPLTHRGVPKPLHYAENKERFAPWSDRIIHVVADDLPVTGNPWVTEHAQRDAGWAAVEDQVRDSDVVLIADVDEFPSARPWRAPSPSRPSPSASRCTPSTGLSRTRTSAPWSPQAGTCAGSCRRRSGTAGTATTPSGRGLAHHVARRSRRSAGEARDQLPPRNARPTRWSGSPQASATATGIHHAGDLQLLARRRGRDVAKGDLRAEMPGILVPAER